MTFPEISPYGHIKLTHIQFNPNQISLTAKLLFPFLGGGFVVGKRNRMGQMRAHKVFNLGVIAIYFLLTYFIAIRVVKSGWRLVHNKFPKVSFGDKSVSCSIIYALNPPGTFLLWHFSLIKSLCKL